MRNIDKILIIGLVFMALFAVSTNATLTSNLVSYYNFTSNANSYTGVNNLNIYGAANIASGKITNGYWFDNSNDIMNKSAGTEGFANAWTINAWAYLNSTSPDDAGFVALWNTTGLTTRNGIILGYNITGTERIEVFAYGSDGVLKKRYNGNTNPSKGTWHMYTVRWDGTTLDIFIDGVADTPYTKTTDLALTQTDNKRQLNIGGLWDGVSFLYSMNGRLDEIGIWSNNKSQIDITSLYNLNIGLQPPFLARNLVIRTYNEETNTQITTETCYTYLTGTASYTYTYTGNTTTTLPVDGNYTARVLCTTDWITARFYNVEINGSGYNLYSYLLANNTNLVTFNVLDSNLLPMADVLVTAKRYYYTPGVYNEVATCMTSMTGQCEMNLKAYQSYAFTLNKDNTTTSIDPFTILDTEYTFYWTADTTFTTLDEVLGITSSVDYNNNTNNFRCYFQTLSGNTHEFCLNLYNVSIYEPNDLFNRTCTNTSSGTILINHNPQNESNYAVCTVNPNNEGIIYVIGNYLEPLTFGGIDSFGKFGLFIVFLFMIIAFGIGITVSPAVAIALPVLIMIIFRFLEIYTADWTYIVGITFMGIVVIYFMERQK